MEKKKKEKKRISKEVVHAQQSVNSRVFRGFVFLFDLYIFCAGNGYPSHTTLRSYLIRNFHVRVDHESSEKRGGWYVPVGLTGD